MSAYLNLYSLTMAVGDAVQNNNPSLRFVDWKRALQGIPVENPKSESLMIPPGVEKLVFDGSRALTIDATTTFDLSRSVIQAGAYRITHTGGVLPGFRTHRANALQGSTIICTANSDGSMTMDAQSPNAWGDVQVGDEVYIPGPMTGDPTSPFNAINQGRWVIIGLNGSWSSATLVRPAGMDFQGITETVTPPDPGQVLTFSADGVQVGDTLDISAGFSPAAQRSFKVSDVTDKWVEFKSTTPLAEESGVMPDATGIRVYSDSKRFVRIEADQECVVRLNGDTGSSVRISPWMPGDPEQVAEFVKVGPTWSLKILNRSTQTLRVSVISAE